jgi:biofilm PGA synthesis protein PgaA
VLAAREGRAAEGVALLERALAAAPGDPGILADLTAVLSWAGHDREALARFESLGAPSAPGYAVVAAAVSARRLGDPARAARLYRLAVERGETGVETWLGLAMAEQARGDAAAARAALAEGEARHPGNERLAAFRAVLDRPPPPPDPAAVADRFRATVEAGGIDAAVAEAVSRARAAPPATVAAIAEALLALRRPFDALRVIEPALAAVPANRALIRQQALALEAVGAPSLALSRAARAPGALTAAEERRVRGGAAAFMVRWGAQVPAPRAAGPAARYAGTDAAIAELDALIAAWTPLGAEAAPAVRLARLDRLVALRDRGRMDEVLVEAARLRAEGELPGYAREAVADALLDRRRPEEAEAEYRAVLDEDPGSFTAALGLFYALTDQRSWEESRAIADRLEAEIPAYRPLRGPEPPEPEWDRIDAVTAGLLWRMWTDDLAGAEAIADPLAAAAPMNGSLRGLRGDIWRLRGWPEKALEEYETALASEPEAIGLRVGRAEALMDRRRWRDAQAEIAALVAEVPENGQVRQVARREAIWRMRELEIEASAGLDRGSQDPEFDIDARLYSAPIDDTWRVFGSTRFRYGSTDDGSLATTRLLAGVEWRGPPAVIRAGGTADFEGVNRGGAFVTSVWRLSDRWSVEASGELTAPDTPLRALRNGIWADGATLGIVWRHSDLRQVAASVRGMSFSDGNERWIGFARWQERVLNLPDWKLDLQPYVYATQNSRDDAPYFNPERDLELGLTGTLTWVVFQRYDRALRARFSATGGGYEQEGFGWSPVFALRWQNDHDLSDTLAVTYGAGWTRRDYDGETEDGFTAIGALRWRF